MKKILVTGARFTGAVELVYGEPGMGADALPPLVSVDIGSTGLDDMQKAYLLKSIPVRYGPGYEQDWGGMTGKVKIVTEDVEVDFERDFWKPYGKKINKDRCLTEWNKLSKANKSLAVFGLAAYFRYLTRSPYGQNKADPENYFKKKMYLNDYDNL